jgi:hypothetical protein
MKNKNMRIGHLPEKSKGEARLVEPQIGANESSWQDQTSVTAQAVIPEYCGKRQLRTPIDLGFFISLLSYDNSQE